MTDIALHRRLMRKRVVPKFIAARENLKCEFCRMRGYSRSGPFKVTVDEIEWQLCYDCMMDECIRGNGTMEKPSYVLWDMAMKIYKKVEEK